MDFRLPRPTNVRLVLGRVAFVLTALTLVWPMHIQAATGASVRGDNDHYALTDFVSQSCPFELRLGHVPSANLLLPRSGETSSGILDNYNNVACTAKRYDRTSEALLWMIIGTLLTVSGVRRRFAVNGLSRATAATV